MSMNVCPTMAAAISIVSTQKEAFLVRAILDTFSTSTVCDV